MPLTQHMFLHVSDLGIYSTALLLAR